MPGSSIICGNVASPITYRRCWHEVSLKSNEVTRRHGSDVAVWDLAAPSYDEARRADAVYQSCITQAVRRIPRGSVSCLDAGCGTGLSTVELQSRIDVVFAVDYSRQSLRVLASRALPNVTAVCSDLMSLPFDDEQFDAVVCANTLQHFKPDGPQQKVVSELRRVTKLNGTICVSVHHYSVEKRSAGWIKEGKPGEPGIDYIYRFDREELLALMPGAKICSVGYYGLMTIPFLGGRIQDLVATLFGGIAGRLGHGHMLIAVEKKKSDPHH